MIDHLTQKDKDLARERILIRAMNQMKTGISREIFEKNQQGLEPAARNHNREIALKLRGPWAWKE